MPSLSSRAGRNHGRGLVNLLRKVHPPQEALKAGVVAEGCTKFWPVATQVGDAKQTKKAVGTAKVSRDALPSRPWRCELGTRGRRAYDCAKGKVEIENSRYGPEAFMAITRNVPKIEKVIRIGLAVMLIPLGVSLTGFWKPLSIIAGVFLVLTAFVGY